jgi:hypothetical protein
MLDTDGSVRLADGVSDDCCCGCPEGCHACGDCCFDEDVMTVRLTVEFVNCWYNEPCDGGMWRKYNFKLSQLMSYWQYNDPESGEVVWYGGGPLTEPCIMDGTREDSPESCEYVEPTEPFLSPPHGINPFVKYNCTTNRWSMFLNAVIEVPGELEDSFSRKTNSVGWFEIGGTCAGLEMGEFAYLPGWGCPGGDDEFGWGYDVIKYRATIEVIDNDDCMAV